MHRRGVGEDAVQVEQARGHAVGETEHGRHLPPHRTAVRSAHARSCPTCAHRDGSRRGACRGVGCAQDRHDHHRGWVHARQDEVLSRSSHRRRHRSARRARRRRHTGVRCRGRSVAAGRLRAGPVLVQQQRDHRECGQHRPRRLRTVAHRAARRPGVTGLRRRCRDQAGRRRPPHVRGADRPARRRRPHQRPHAVDRAAGHLARDALPRPRCGGARTSSSTGSTASRRATRPAASLRSTSRPVRRRGTSSSTPARSRWSCGTTT